MRLLKILFTLALLLVVLVVAVYWGAPIALSFYAVRKAPPIAWITPTNLKDSSISQNPGTRLSYFGYEFEVPWADLEESKTKLYPENKPEKTRVVLSFHSGLRLAFTALPAQEYANGFISGTIGIKVSPAAFEAAFGREATLSDYAFMKRVLEFTPAKMHHWTLQTRILALEESLLIIKSMMSTKAAETGIFNISNGGYRGFQQGDPQVRQNWLLVDLYPDNSNNGGVEVDFFQKDYASSTVTQPEINRIVHSLHRASLSEVATSRN